MLTRRAIVAGAAAMFARPAATAAGDTVFASAWLRGESAGVSLLDEAGAVLADIPLPGRGHDVTHHPQSGMTVAFARRPGTFAVAFGRDRAPVAFATPADRHFFGHGVFSPDGRLLYATENDFDAARGVVGVYDASDRFRRIGEFASHGIDPHDMALLDDGRTLVIANGGIETHPDFARAKLNLDAMEPSVAFVDREAGDLVQKHTLPAALSRLSTRHMDIDSQGHVWIGCQWEGAASERPPLVARVRRDEDLAFVDLPDEPLAALANYVGSVAVNRGSGLVALTSPHGNAALWLDTRTGRPVHIERQPDVCGLAAAGDVFVTSTGTGLFAGTLSARVWDNHIASLVRG